MASLSGSQGDEDLASSKVGSTYELIEEILAYLPIRRVFLAQQVNKDWQHVVQRSYPLQKKMLLLPRHAPIDPTTVYGCLEYSHPDFKLSPLLDIHLPKCFFTIDAKTPGCKAMCASTRPDHKKPYDDGQSSIEAPIELHFLSTDREEKSWYRVPISNPPITEVTITNCERETGSLCRSHGWHCHTWEVYEPKGLTMGDVYRAHLDFMEARAREGHKVLQHHVVATFFVKRTIPVCEGWRFSYRIRAHDSSSRYDARCFLPLAGKGHD